MQGETKMVKRLPVYFHSSVQTPEPQPWPINTSRKGLSLKRKGSGLGRENNLALQGQLTSFLSFLPGNVKAICRGRPCSTLRQEVGKHVNPHSTSLGVSYKFQIADQSAEQLLGIWQQMPKIIQSKHKGKESGQVKMREKKSEHWKSTVFSGIITETRWEIY